MTKQTLLICDDEEGIREALKLILADHYTIILTEDGQQCLDILKNTSDVSLVLIDIKMPKVNGLEILKEIKSRYPPFVSLSLPATVPSKPPLKPPILAPAATSSNHLSQMKSSKR